MLGKLFELLGIPAVIQPFSYRAGGQDLQLRTSERYAILSVNGVDIYFLRENGKLDGYGINHAV